MPCQLHTTHLETIYYFKNTHGEGVRKGRHAICNLDPRQFPFGADTINMPVMEVTDCALMIYSPFPWIEVVQS